MVDQGYIDHIIQMFPKAQPGLGNDLLSQRHMFHGNILNQHLKLVADLPLRQGIYLIHCFRVDGLSCFLFKADPSSHDDLLVSMVIQHYRHVVI